MRVTASVPDPGSGAFLTGMGKKDSGSGFGMWIRDEQPRSYFLGCLESIFLGEILQFFDADPGSGMEKIWIRVPRQH
jgi:hypothetical protein